MSKATCKKNPMKELFFWIYKLQRDIFEIGGVVFSKCAGKVISKLLWTRQGVCVCVCVCVWGRERESKRNLEVTMDEARCVCVCVCVFVCVCVCA